MPNPIIHRLRLGCALSALLVCGAALGGCAGVGDTISPAFADPGKYELYDCKQLETERKALAARITDLQKLMDKAETGVGGAVVSELAYRNEYVAVRGQQHFADEAWRKSKCQEAPPPGAQTAIAPPAPSAPSSAAKRPASSKSGAPVH